MSLADALDILYEDNHLVALNKPSGWPTAHAGEGEPTLDRLVKDYLKEKYAKPGNVFLGVVHRLDKPVSGVLLFARTSKAAARLAEQFRHGTIEKVYWAVVDGDWPHRKSGGGWRVDGESTKPSTLHPPPSTLSAEAGTLEDWLAHSGSRVEVVAPGTPGAQHAVLHYYQKTKHNARTLLELRPQTGRKHQLRVQLASRGFPVYGDRKYGSRESLGPAIALHARSATFLHPTKHEPITLTAEIPRAWRGRFAHLLPPEALA